MNDSIEASRRLPRIYKAAGDLQAVRILLGHTKIGSAARHLGMDVEDALHIAERTDVLGGAGFAFG